jgi:hypothetical protein
MDRQMDRRGYLESLKGGGEKNVMSTWLMTKKKLNFFFGVIIVIIGSS